MTDQRQTTFLGTVGRFFFSPTDPTTLGFIRLITGFVLLYTHAAYTPDLLEFVGPHGWWDHPIANKQRREQHSVNTPLGWQQFHPTLQSLDDVPHRRAAEIEFFRSLPLDPAARKEQMRYLKRLIDLTPASDDPQASQRAGAQYQAGLFLANSAARLTTAEQKVRVLQVLAAETVDDTQSPVHFPEVIRALKPDDRKDVWLAALDFSAALPADLEKQEFLLQWLANYPGGHRADLHAFLVGDKRDKDGRDWSLPADPRDREEFLDYLNTWGIDPRQVDSKGTDVFSHWYHLSDPTTMYAVHAAFLVVCVLFALGLFTRVTSVLAWAGSLCYIHRGQITLFGQDTMQTILLTYLMVGPCGAALSLDALRKRFRAAKVVLGGGRSVPWAEAALAGPARTWLANFAVRLIQINFCVIYASSGLSKLKGTTWWDHSAPWLIFANPEFGLVRYPAYESLLRFAAEQRVFLYAFSGFATLFTLFVELGFPALVWTRLRPVMVSLSVLLHFGIAIFMGLVVFGLYMFAMVLGFVPARLIRERVCVTPGGGRKLTLHYDSKDPKALTTAARIKALDLGGQVTFVDTAGKAGGVGLTDPEGREHRGRDLARTALRELSLLRPVRFLAAVV